MRISIIGSGAMGTVFAALLSRAGHDVTLLARRSLYLDAIKDKGGLSVEIQGTEHIVPCRLVLSPCELGASELALLFVKSLHTDEAAKAIAPCLPPDCPVLSLQNGLGNMEIIRERLANNPVFAGVTTCAATLLEPGHSRLVTVGKTVIAPYEPVDTGYTPRLAALLTDAGFPSVAEQDIRPFLWQKLLINIAINPLTALTDLKNGEIALSASLRSVAEEAIAEGEALAAALGIAIAGNSRERFVAVCEATSDNYSSMAQDIRAGRPTEIDALNGAVTRLGQQAGIPTPVNATLTALIRDKETRSKTL